MYICILQIYKYTHMCVYICIYRYIYYIYLHITFIDLYVYIHTYYIYIYITKNYIHGASGYGWSKPCPNHLLQLLHGRLTAEEPVGKALWVIDIVSFPIKKKIIFHSNIGLPEGNGWENVVTFDRFSLVFLHLFYVFFSPSSWWASPIVT